MATKRRRSPVEARTAKEILAKASKAPKPDPAAFRDADRYTKAAMASKRFGLARAPDGLLIHRFRTPGETLVGVLGDCDGLTGFEATYPIVQDDGSVVRIPGNRRLVKAFRKAKCLYQRIRITYEGKLRTGNGHCEKVYRVEAAPMDKEPMTAAGRNLIEQAAAEAKARRRS